MNEYDKAIKIALPGMSVLSVYEYPSCYVYNMISDKQKEKMESDPNDLFTKPMDCSYRVDKKTKIVTVFAPFEMKKEEYKKGKKIR